MLHKFLAFAYALIGLVAGAGAQSVPESSLPNDGEIHKILAQRIENAQGVGIVVGVIDHSGRRVVAHGNFAKGDSRTLNGDTLFEIGSVTKVFTSLLLADMAGHGEVSLTDPVQNYLPAGSKMPEHGGRAITLVDLATHTSGLPRLPTNLKPKDVTNPYADYSLEQLNQFLSTYQLTRDIGAKYEYSNLGGGLLGSVLARREGVDYESLVRSRICKPLAMKSTVITLTPELKARLAVGHNRALESVPNWDFPTLSGAGALRSSANDLLSFLAAALGYSRSPLAPAMAAMLQVRRPTGVPALAIGLGWHVFERHGKEIIWHNGETAGYRAFLGYDPKSRTGVVVLSNAVTALGVDDIGMHLLDPLVPLREPPKQHKQVAVDPRLFAGYIGRYELAPGFILTVTQEDGRLFVQATGQSRLEVFSEGERDYFYKLVDAQITMETDGQGQATALVLHQNGADRRAKRIE
jgi:serine-type D-Ala-D-Ala carboxypeptidase/endopeptidase